VKVEGPGHRTASGPPGMANNVEPGEPCAELMATPRKVLLHWLTKAESPLPHTGPGLLLLPSPPSLSLESRPLAVGPEYYYVQF
jgi:hypothetical protein